MPYHPPTQAFKNAPVCGTGRPRRSNLVCPVDVKEQPGGTLPDIQIADYAVKFLKNYSDSKPFFLAVGFHKPHIPLKYPNEYLGKQGHPRRPDQICILNYSLMIIVSPDLYPIESVGLAPDPRRPSLLPSVAWNPWTDVRARDDIGGLNVSFPYGPIPHHEQVSSFAFYGPQ